MKYIAVLRGINVSGQKQIKMVDLKALFVSLGFAQVETYIQSGNVVFDGVTKQDTKKMIRDIEKAIEDQYGFQVPVLIRTSGEWQKIIKACPFGEVDLANDGTKVMLTLLASKPANSNIKAIKQYVKEPEQLYVNGQEVYLYCPGGYGKSKLSNNFIETKLAVTATTRNWKSVCKLDELLS